MQPCNIQSVCYLSILFIYATFLVSSFNFFLFVGDPTDLFEAVVCKDITVIQGCGLGGTSLINANVALDADPRVFQDQRWPEEIRNDMDKLLDVDRKHVHEMLRPNVYPDHYPKPKKLEAMEKAAKGLGIPDIEDIGQIFKKTPLYVF